ncbi:MAG: CoA transferase, partial [Chloroflexi bacterium]|nr:CoA transferase [Chloroflexota bacterium]
MSRPGALHGIRVIDMSTSVSGAWCARMLADFGAEVALIEGLNGHPARRLGPFDDDEKSVVAEYVLANRPSAVLDIAHASGIAALQSAISRADVFVCSVSPDELTAAGLNIERLRQSNPRLIICSITPHGSTGVRATRPGNN